MFKFVLNFFILSLLTSQAQASCDLRDFFNMKPSPYAGVSEYELRKQIDRTEWVTNLLRKPRGHARPAINIQLEKEIAIRDARLMDGGYGYDSAKRDWQPLFRDVELAYVLIKKNKKVLNALDELDGDELWPAVKRKLIRFGLDDDFISVVAEQFKHADRSVSKLQANIQEIYNNELVNLGNGYHEYALVRHHLEDMLGEDNCGQDCKKSVRSLLEDMGIGALSERTRFSRLLVGERPPTFRQIKILLNENPLAILARLKKERNAELPALLMDIALNKTLLDDMFQLFMATPGVHLTRAVRLFYFIYDAQARVHFFPPINRIVRSTENAAGKYHKLRGEVASEEGDEILITFARRVDEQTKKTWQALRTYAQFNDKGFFKRMQKAEGKARGRGDISLLPNGKPTAKLLTFLSVSGTLIGYNYFGLEKSEAPAEVNIPWSDQDEQDDNNETSEGSEIPLGGEEDQILDELGELIAKSQSPESSFLFKQKDRLPASKKIPPTKFPKWFMGNFYKLKFWLFPPGAPIN